MLWLPQVVSRCKLEFTEIIKPNKIVAAIPISKNRFVPFWIQVVILYVHRRLFQASSISSRFEGGPWEDTGQGDFQNPALPESKVGISQSDGTFKIVVVKASVEILNCTDFIIHHTKCDSILFTVTRVWSSINLFNFWIQTEFKMWNI